jgi:polar amino acid transport system substrate-binding protein
LPTGWAAQQGAADPHAAAALTVLLEPIAPYSYQDGEGKPAGYSVALTRVLLQRCKLTASLEFNSWASIYQRVQTQPRVLVVNMVRFEERESLFYWIGPTATRRVFFYRLKARPEVQLASIEGAKAYRTAVIQDDATERDLLTRGFEQGRHLDRSPDYAAVLRKLFARRCELVALNSAVAQDTLTRYGYEPSQIEPLVKLSDSLVYMALSRSSGEALHRQLLRCWEAMRRDGTVAAIAARFPTVSID